MLLAQVRQTGGRLLRWSEEGSWCREFYKHFVPTGRGTVRKILFRKQEVRPLYYRGCTEIFFFRDHLAEGVPVPHANHNPVLIIQS
jgi:hypothetical protein